MCQRSSYLDTVRRPYGLPRYRCPHCGHEIATEGLRKDENDSARASLVRRLDAGGQKADAEFALLDKYPAEASRLATLIPTEDVAGDGALELLRRHGGPDPFRQLVLDLTEMQRDARKTILLAPLEVALFTAAVYGVGILVAQSYPNAHNTPWSSSFLAFVLSFSWRIWSLRQRRRRIAHVLRILAEPAVAGGLAVAFRERTLRKTLAPILAGVLACVDSSVAERYGEDERRAISDLLDSSESRLTNGALHVLSLVGARESVAALERFVHSGPAQFHARAEEVLTAVRARAARQEDQATLLRAAPAGEEPDKLLRSAGEGAVDPQQLLRADSEPPP